jgi:aminodeoxyfutalosine deaminase
MVIRARCLLPISAPLIDNGALVIDNGRITWIGPWPQLPIELAEDVLDLGEVVLMPGLINAHCHLDYTNMGGHIPPPSSFPDWIKTILSFKAHWSFSEFAESWLNGARMLLDSGTTTVADIESAPELPAETWKATPLRIVSYYEMTGVKTRRPPEEILREALHWLEGLPKLPGKEGAISPHALYSTTPDLMRKAAHFARERDLLVSTHLAESESEFQMFTAGGGPFYDWLKGQRDMSDCGQGSPVQLASQYGLLNDKFLAVHVNYLAPGDADLLGQARASVVHCPRSHDYFEHASFPFDELKNAGVRICLGTDSLASSRKEKGVNPRLDLWDEMRLFSRKYPKVAPREIFEMVTSVPAAALGKTGELGAFQLKALADCVALTYSGPVQEKRLYEEVLHAGSVREVFIGGELVRQP